MSADPIIQALIENDAYKMEVDTVTISHPAWSTPLRFTRNYLRGRSFNATLETGETVTFQYLPMVIKRAGQDGNLNQSWSLVLQDLNTQVQEQADTIPLDDDRLPTIEIRTFQYDKRTGQTTLLDGPYITSASGIDFDDKGASINAEANRINNSGTGFKMTPNRYPTLRPLMR